MHASEADNPQTPSDAPGAEGAPDLSRRPLTEARAHQSPRPVEADAVEAEPADPYYPAEPGTEAIAAPAVGGWDEARTETVTGAVPDPYVASEDESAYDNDLPDPSSAEYWEGDGAEHQVEEYVEEHHEASGSTSPMVWLLCLVAVLLSGAALAASAGLVDLNASGGTVPPNSVGDEQVIAGSLQSDDLSAEAQAALKGAVGPAGEDGPKGPEGPAGPAGQGLKNIELAEASSNNAPDENKVIEAECGDEHQILVGGGVDVDAPVTLPVRITSSSATKGGTWRAHAVSTQPEKEAVNWTLTAQAFCATLTKPTKATKPAKGTAKTAKTKKPALTGPPATADGAPVGE